MIDNQIEMITLIYKWGYDEVCNMSHGERVNWYKKACVIQRKRNEDIENMNNQ